MSRARRAFYATRPASRNTGRPGSIAGSSRAPIRRACGCWKWRPGASITGTGRTKAKSPSAQGPAPSRGGGLLRSGAEDRSPGHEADRLDLVAVGIAHEGAVVVRVVLRPQARRTRIAAALGERDAVELLDRLTALGDEGHVHAIADAGRLAVDRLFEAEADRRRAVVDRPAAALALADAEHGEDRIVECRRARGVTGAEGDVTEHGEGTREEARVSGPVAGTARSVDDLGPALGLHPREGSLHLRQPLGRMRLPLLDLADNAERFARAVGLSRIAGKALVGEVGIVLEGPGRLDDIDTLAPLSLRQLTPPCRRIERAGEVDPRQLAVGVVGGEAGREQIPRREIGAGAVVEGAGGVFGVSHRAM